MRRRYRYDKEQDRMIEVGIAAPPPVHFIEDNYHRNPVVSPVDMTVLDSRSALRRHNLANNVVDVGNDPAAAPGPREWVPMPPAGPDIKEAFDRLGISDRDLY